MRTIRGLQVNSRKSEFAVDRARGHIKHALSGLQYRVEPLRSEHGDIEPRRRTELESTGYTACGQCWLPSGVVDRRQPGQIAPGDVNAPGVTRWAVLGDPGAQQAYFDALALQVGTDQAQQMLARINRRAGDAWVYHARLDRERPQTQKSPPPREGWGA